MRTRALGAANGMADDSGPSAWRDEYLQPNGAVGSGAGRR